MKIKFNYSSQEQLVQINSGFSCFEIICARTLKTIGGNVIHSKRIRESAIKKYSF